MEYDKHILKTPEVMEIVDNFIKTNKQLKVELTEKDKVLQWYGDESNYYSHDSDGRGLSVNVEIGGGALDTGDRARQVMKKYKEAQDE